MRIRGDNERFERRLIKGYSYYSLFVGDFWGANTMGEYRNSHKKRYNFITRC